MSPAADEQRPSHGRRNTLMSLDIQYIPLSFDNANADASALKLIETYAPEWQDERDGPVVFVRFTDGITNTLTKATKNKPGKTKSEIDQDAILLRAYGSGTDVLIDREREIKAHNALASRGLAPELLARFDNGLMYRFVEGDVCSPQGLRRPDIYKQVAKRLGQWHASIPISEISKMIVSNANGATNGHPRAPRPTPNTWSVMQQWIKALPERTEEEQKQRQLLSTELELLEHRFGNLPGLLNKDFIFGHCDLLSGNVIVEHAKEEGAPRPVSFIDYEYATPSPAAFDIANHFAEWAGFDCDHTGCPSKSQRREFIRDYVESFYCHAGPEGEGADIEAAAQQVYDQVDDCRGLPGFYWGIWAVIQAEISDIDFNYKEYAQIRLGEYWAWKHGDSSSPRERRWAEE